MRMAEMGTLEQLSDGMWTVRGWAKLMPSFYFPISSTIVRLKDGGLFIHSPVDFSDEVAAKIRALGEVTTIFSPNLYHTLYLSRAKHLFPEAKLIGPRGIEKKKPDLVFDELFSPQSAVHLSPDFASVFVEGAPKLSEMVLVHGASGTLLTGDYFFNMRETKGFLAPVMLNLVTGGYGRPMQSKLWKKFAKDRLAMRKAAEQILAFDFDRILVCHGEPIDAGKDFVRREVEWLFDS